MGTQRPVPFRDVSPRRGTGRAAGRILLLLVVASGCSQPADPEALRSEAIGHLSRGEHQSALEALRTAMGARPDDPDLRLLTARAYLQAGRGRLAEVAVAQAIERGADRPSTVVLTAEALLLQKRFAALLELPSPAGLADGPGIRLQLLKAHALRNIADTPALEETITRAYLALLDRITALADLEQARKASHELSTLRSSHPEIDQAWAHVECRGVEAVPQRWEPIPTGERRVIRVGPSRRVRTPAEAAAMARDGDVVLLDPGHYPSGVAQWAQNELLVRGQGEGPLISADGQSVQQRDIWLFTGNGVTIENVTLSGARSPFGNGAGIRHTGSGLTLRHVRLMDNENGLLTGNRHPDGETLIEFSEFANNGDEIGQAHNIYVGRSARLTLRYSYSHGARSGHLVKSRAQQNFIAYNRLTDGPEGSSSYLIDLPDGGTATILGNELEQSAETRNHAMVSFAGEGVRHRDNGLVVASNSIYNRDFQGILVRNHSTVAIRLQNNLIGGAPIALGTGPHLGDGNLTTPAHGMVDPRALEFLLKPGAGAIDRAVPGEPTPESEYVHPLTYRKRQVVWRLDVGAHEHCGL